MNKNSFLKMCCIICFAIFSLYCVSAEALHVDAMKIIDKYAEWVSYLSGNDLSVEINERTNKGGISRIRMENLFIKMENDSGYVKTITFNYDVPFNIQDLESYKLKAFLLACLDEDVYDVISSAGEIESVQERMEPIMDAITLKVKELSKDSSSVLIHPAVYSDENWRFDVSKISEYMMTVIALPIE